MTRRLFDEDAYLFTFSATVERCRKTADGFAVLLDGTAFFPQGGGQCADGGTLSGLPVRDVRQEGDEIWHFVPQALIPGQTVQGAVEREERLARMRKHSAEHIVCGLIHRAYGFSNVGFHLGSEDVTMDIDGELDRPAIDGIERQANAAVRADLPVTARYPAPAELRGMTYRGKGPADGAVRIVTIGDVDACACCAPHVAHTGEIGAIKLLEAIRYKGGMRIHLQAGADATEEARLCFAQNAQIAAALSVRRGEAHDAVQRLLAERDALVRQLRAARREGALLHAAAAEIPVSGAACLILSPADDEAVRDAALALAARGARPCAVFSGSDGQGYAYVAAGGEELPAFARGLNAALDGRGGGKGPLMRGRVNAAADRIRAFCAGFGV